MNPPRVGVHLINVERGEYRALLATYRAELARALSRLHARGGRIVIVVEGRDGAGKTGAIRRLVRDLSPSMYRVVHLGPPEPGRPYLDRWREELARPTTCTVLDRSWYNRAALEPVMGYCTTTEAAAFLAEVPAFERELVRDGVVLVKLLLEVTRDEQARRLARRAAPTPIDRLAVERWDEYSDAIATMLARTDTAHAPWLCLDADEKRTTRLRLIRATIDAITESHPQEVEHGDVSRQLRGV